MNKLLVYIPYFRKKYLLKELQQQTDEKFVELMTQIEQVPQEDYEEFFRLHDKINDLLNHLLERELEIRG